MSDGNDLDKRLDRMIKILVIITLSMIITSISIGWLFFVLSYA